MFFCDFTFGKDKKSDLALVRDDGQLYKVMIEERFNKCKDYSGFPYHCLDLLSDKINKNIVFNYIEDNIVNKVRKFFPNLIFDDYRLDNEYYYKIYESFYTSGFNRAAILVINGIYDHSNNESNIVLGQKFKKETKILKIFDKKYSLGKFYKDAINVLGLNEEEEFFKYVSYGKPYENKYILYDNNELFFNYNKNDWYENFGYDKKKLDNQKRYNFAATIQKNLNDCVIDLLRQLKKITGEDKVCLSGGIFNNLILNNEICNSKIFHKVHCFPIPGIYSDSIGASYYLYEKKVEKYQNIKLLNDSLGHSYSDQNIVDYLNNYSIEYKIIESDKIAELIQNNLVCWFDGASNIGHYTNINRCIMGNSTLFSSSNIFLFDRDSVYIKKMLSIITTNDFFNNDNFDLLEYGLRLMCINDNFNEKLPIDINKTVKTVLINKNTYPIIYNIVMQFYKKTNIPFIMYIPFYNFSDTLVETIGQCLNYYVKNTNINYLIFNNKFLIEKKSLLYKSNFYSDQ